MRSFRQAPGQSLWGLATPGTQSGDTNPTVIRTVLHATVPGRVSGIRYFRDLSDGGNHIGVVRFPVSVIATASVFQHIPASGSGPDRWYGQFLKKWVHVNAGDIFQIVVYYSAGLYYGQRGALLAGPYTSGNLVAHQDNAGGTGFNGAFGYNLTFNPTASAGGSLWGNDIFFVPD